MMGSDSQAMGRMAEMICRTWQVAHHMKQERGGLTDADNDNLRVKRYVSKYTLGPAVAAGIDGYVGSIEEGKLADIALWDTGFFGIKPELVLKGGFPAWSQMGESNGSIMTCQPVVSRPREGALGKTRNTTSLAFVSKTAYDEGVGEEYGLDKAVVPVEGIRSLSSDDMPHNEFVPDDISVDPETFEVTVDDETVTCEPMEEVPLAQRYLLG